VQATLNEKNAPEILDYKEELTVRLQGALDAQVRDQSRVGQPAVRLNSSYRECAVGAPTLLTTPHGPAGGLCGGTGDGYEPGIAADDAELGKQARALFAEVVPQDAALQD